VKNSNMSVKQLTYLTITITAYSFLIVSFVPAPQDGDDGDGDGGIMAEIQRQMVGIQ
jgi:hypothetical protein